MMKNKSSFEQIAAFKKHEVQGFVSNIFKYTV